MNMRLNKSSNGGMNLDMNRGMGMNRIMSSGINMGFNKSTNRDIIQEQRNEYGLNMGISRRNTIGDVVGETEQRT